MPSVPKQVKAFLLNPPDDRIGVALSWKANEELDLDHYNVYRIGAMAQSSDIAPNVPVADLDTLTIIIDGGKTQTIVFSVAFITAGAATAQELADNINSSIVGATALVAQTPANPALLIRSNNQTKSGAVEIVGGTAKPIIGFSDGVYWNNPDLGTSQKIGEVAAPGVSFTDLDGLPSDFYYVEAETTVPLIGQRSILKKLNKIVDEVAQTIFIFGRIYGAGGIPVENTEVFIRPGQNSRPSLNEEGFRDNFFDFSSSDFGISFEPHVVKTDADGYFEIPAVVNTKLRLIIPAIDYDHEVHTEDQTIDFTKLRLFR